jgi:hypothetical protein
VNFWTFIDRNSGEVVVALIVIFGLGGAAVITVAKETRPQPAPCICADGGAL